MKAVTHRIKVEGHLMIVGVTGYPGVGKTSILRQITKFLRGKGYIIPGGIQRKSIPTSDSPDGETSIILETMAVYRPVP
jgi:broad-specificity NMP kinase